MSQQRKKLPPIKIRRSDLRTLKGQGRKRGQECSRIDPSDPFGIREGRGATLRDKIQLHREVMENSKVKINLAIKKLQVEVVKLTGKKVVSKDFARMKSSITREFSSMKSKMEAVIKS